MMLYNALHITLLLLSCYLVPSVILVSFHFYFLNSLVTANEGIFVKPMAMTSHYPSSILF